MLDPNVFLQNPAPDFKMNQLCKVCGEPAAGFHFGAFTCEGCKSFFGRTYNNVSGIAECKNGGRCEINKKNRTSCKSCRLRKCLRVGMSKSGSRYGRRSNWFKIHCLLQAQQQNGGGGPETNNNSPTTTNNNSSPNFQSNYGKSPVPSTITSFGPLGDRDRERERGERERTPSSSISRNGGGPNGLPPGFTGISNLSPESLPSLNRKINHSELAEYFRAAGMGGMDEGGPPGAKRLCSKGDRGDEIPRPTRSPGSLESPKSEISTEDAKSNTPLFSMPPGSPMEVKPNELLPFDLITRDLMKMGYDPLRLWPAMFTAQPNLHSFNPYPFMFPNFPGAGAAFPGGFPPNPNAVPSRLLNGVLHPAAKLYSTQEGVPTSPLGNVSSNPLSASSVNNSREQAHSPSSRTSSSPNPTPFRGRVVPIVPPSSSITLTPPISHHGSEDPSLFPLQKLRNVPPQDKPIDLSAKSTNNNQVDVHFHEKLYSRMHNGDTSEEDENIDNNESDNEKESNSDAESRRVKSEYEEDSDKEVEDLSSSNNHLSVAKDSLSRRLSSESRSRSPIMHSPKRASTPLDLTRGSGNSNSSPPATKIAT